MMCDHDDLLGLARGELSPERAAEVERHVAGCASCERELRWLRTERALFRAQVAAPAPHVWQAVERRVAIAGEQRRARWQRWLQVGTAATLVAAAAGFLIVTWGNGLRRAQVASLPAGSTEARPASRTPEPEPPAQASRVLDDAELRYLAAIQKLETAYVDERARLDPDEARQVDRQLRSLREQLESERALAQDDVWARRRVLRTYSAYMHTMQTVVVAQATGGMGNPGPEDEK